MKIINLIESMLLEATPQEIYNSYYTDVPYGVFTKIVLSDPNTLRTGNDLKKIGKYSKLLLTMYKRGELKIEDLPKATEYLTYVYKHKVGLDVNKIRNLSDLYQVVKQYYTREAKDLPTVLKALSPEDYRKVYQGEKWSVYVPLTESGACYLGVNTEWCTAWGSKSLNPDYQERESRFKFHNNKGRLYIIVNNSDFNERYQFHFETNQYMDINDRGIDTGKFLDNNPDIRNFFFPSFVKPDLGEDEIESQIDKMSVLSSDSISDLMGILLEKSAETNPLIKAISDSDEDKVNQLIVDENLKDQIEFNRDRINFTFDRLYGDLSSVEGVVSYYESDKYYSGDRLYDDVTNWDDDNQYMESFFKEYYENEKDKLSSSYGIINYEQFKSEFYDEFNENKKIKEGFNEQFVSLNIQAYESKLQESIDDIEKYIRFSKSGYRGLEVVEVNIGFFMLFLAKKNISSINGNTEDILDGYLSYNNIQSEYEGIYEYNHTPVKYKDLENEIESFFDDKLDDYGDVQECSKLRLLLSDIIKKLFNNKTYFENDIVSVQINDNGKIDCEDGTVNITYTNKKTNKKIEGPVKIENLSTYVTNYPLFESIMNFKRII